MDYNLAKQLKDAGFPVGKEGNFAVETVIVKNGEEKHEFDLYYPTLSELIEACGDRFIVLKRMEGNPFNYTGKLDRTIWWMCPSPSEYGEYVNEGQTPEEAVAKLWLTLNKKDELQ